jgi:predicted amidohydrolase
MRAALGVFRAGPDRRLNLAKMTALCEQAASHGADLVAFPHQVSPAGSAA